MLLSARMSAITARAPALSQMRAKAWVGVVAADKADRNHAGGMGRRNPGRQILDHDALSWADAHLGRDVEEQIRRGFAAGNVARRKQIRLEESQKIPVLSRLTRTRSSGAEEATHFGPRSQVRACSTWAVARSSARSRRSVAAANVVAKSGGSLHCVAASISASMSVGRRPAKKRATMSGATTKPARVSSVDATSATIGSLSTSTPLQSKMNTGGPRHGRYPGSAAYVRKVIRMARLWTRLSAMKCGH